MQKIRLDIGGPKGNAFYIMGTVRQFVDADEADVICAKMRGDAYVALGGNAHNYESFLRIYLDEFPFIELYATHDIGIDQELYTLDPLPEVLEL